MIASALPVSVPSLTANQLRGRILASADESYSGYAESNTTFGLPALTGLADLTSLLDGVTKMAVWQAAPHRWRVDVLSDAGERDTYQLGSRTWLWASGQELLTEVLGQLALRLPRPADLVPPGLEGLLARLAGRARIPVTTQFDTIGVYGGGLATFVVLSVPGDSGRSLVSGTLSAGGTPLDLTGGTGALISAPLVNAVIIRPAGFYLTFLIAGTVSARLLEQAAAELVTDREALL